MHSDRSAQELAVFQANTNMLNMLAAKENADQKEILSQRGDYREVKSDPYPMNLSDLTTQVQAILATESKAGNVVFDFGSASPRGFSGYRGDENSLGLQFTGEYSFECPANTFLAMLRSTPGKQFSTWKGYPMTAQLHAEIYIACEGQCSNTRISSVFFDGLNIVLNTFSEDE
jgi:hypothetical protein